MLSNKLPHAETYEHPKFNLTQIRVNRQGYSSNGDYWGVGDPVYSASSEVEAGDIQFYLRADTREKAKEYVKIAYSNARFYR